ncbi:MAG: SUMF1/EgtB/PvdO family nonheme iron enzyme [Bacteroidetes bacterium]|nr:SUMF1/EgtB/PvdO family nonheme iron enzyme [Bacteroidota bacterium]
MKTTLVIFTFLASLTSFPQLESPIPQTSTNMRNLEKSMVEVNETLYVSKYEVSNIDYREFLGYLDQNSQTYQQSVVDSMKWDEVLAYSDPLKEAYFSHPAFHLYPVVNISHQGAKNYCEWLTTIYNQDEKRRYKEVIFRLPTEIEWEAIARRGFEPDHQGDWPTLEDQKGRVQANFRYVMQQAVRENKAEGVITVEPFATSKMSGKKAHFITAPVESYEKDEMGLYNIFGNVAEMVAEPGISKGGHWWSTGYALKVDEKESYNSPNPFVGFRVMMEIITE